MVCIQLTYQISIGRHYIVDIINILQVILVLSNCTDQSLVSDWFYLDVRILYRDIKIFFSKNIETDIRHIWSI